MYINNSILQWNPTEVRKSKALFCLLAAFWAPLGLSWASSCPAPLACRACLGLSTAFLGLSTACLGLRTAIPGLQDCLKASLRAAKTAANCNVLLKYIQNSCQFPQNSWSTVLLSPDGDICNTSIYIYIYRLECSRRYPSTMKRCWQGVLWKLAAVLDVLKEYVATGSRFGSP